MASLESRVSSLEEHRRNRDNHDDRVLVLMEKIQKDVHVMNLRFEKKISFIGGVTFAISFMGGSIGALLIYAAKKAGLVT